MIQLASFHPRYQFAGTEADDVTNFTNRSPYPTLHLLREASIDRAVEAIRRSRRPSYEANMKTLRSLGRGRLGCAGRRAHAMKAETLELRPGQSTELLKELHILTRDGRINQDSRRKLKQVYHLYQFIEKLLLELPETPDGPTLADHGAGKSYLGFILYDLYFKQRGDGHIYGIETRAELVEKVARAGGAARIRAHVVPEPERGAGGRRGRAAGQRIDVVTALHACDTATDDAIAFGLRKQARFMVLVPCCQAEMAACLRQNKALALSRTPLAELWRHPLHTRELGSQLTNVLRCLYLEACGYQVTVTELVGWEHSLKNELILARLHRPEEAQRRPTAACGPGRIRPGGAGADPLPADFNWGQIPIYHWLSDRLRHRHGSPSATDRPRLSPPHHPARQQSPADLRRQRGLRDAAGACWTSTRGSRALPFTPMC